MGVLHALRLDRIQPARDARKSVHRAIFLEMIARSLKRGAKYPNVLDLGAALGANVEFLSTFAKKIHLEDLGALLSDSKKAAKANETASPDFSTARFASASLKYDLILAWDLFNYLSPSELKTLSRQLAASCRPGTMLVAYFCIAKEMGAKPGTIRLLADNQIEFDKARRETITCPRYSKSQLRAFLPGFRRSRSLLLSNSFEEYVFTAR